MEPALGAPPGTGGVAGQCCGVADGLAAHIAQVTAFPPLNPDYLVSHHTLWGPAAHSILPKPTGAVAEQVPSSAPSLPKELFSLWAQWRLSHGALGSLNEPLWGLEQPGCSPGVSSSPVVLHKWCSMLMVVFCRQRLLDSSSSSLIALTEI